MWTVFHFVLFCRVGERLDDSASSSGATGAHAPAPASTSAAAAAVPSACAAAGPSSAPAAGAGGNRNNSDTTVLRRSRRLMGRRATDTAQLYVARVRPYLNQQNDSTPELQAGNGRSGNGHGNNNGQSEGDGNGHSGDSVAQHSAIALPPLGGAGAMVQVFGFFEATRHLSFREAENVGEFDEVSKLSSASGAMCAVPEALCVVCVSEKCAWYTLKSALIILYLQVFAKLFPSRTMPYDVAESSA